MVYKDDAESYRGTSYKPSDYQISGIYDSDLDAKIEVNANLRDWKRRP